MELVIPEKKKMKVTIYGHEYLVSKPTMAMMENYVDGLEGLSEKDKLKKSKDLVVSLGIPLSVLDELEVDHFTQLMNFLTDQVKKN